MVDAPVQNTVTVAGASAGYAPPEQYEVGNRRVGPPTDVFAFAAILFEALSGCEAFPVPPNDTALRLVARMLSGDRPALAKVSATIPRELRDRPELVATLDREIARATDGDPGKRHQTIDELWNTVEPILRASTGSVPGVVRLSEPPPVSMVPMSEVAASHEAPPAISARFTGKPLTGERLRGAAFAADGLSLVAIGAYGMYRFATGVWSALRAPRGIDGRSLRGIARAPSGELLVCGDGAAAIIHADGNAAQIEIADSDAVWLGALADEHGMILTGERRSRPSGIVAVLPAGGPAKVMEIEGTARLHAAARLAGGLVLVCGTHGALFALDGDDVQEIVWGRTGHLYAAAPSHDGGAYVVGSGGHALAIAPPHPSLRGVAPEATLEAVQTTRDITSVTVDVEGTAWAVGAQGRLLARQDGTWSRVPADTGSAALVAVAARSQEGRVHEVVALAEDGTVVEIALT
jgi:eukaryotic-like serine/threonine-protein kinase